MKNRVFFHHVIGLALVAWLGVLNVGCASQPHEPSPEIQSAVRSRLAAYSDAWIAGDAQAVQECFVVRAPDEADFADALGKLAAAQKELLAVQSTVPESFASISRTPTDPIISLSRPWHIYAYAAARPPDEMGFKKDVVTLPLMRSGNVAVSLREVDDHWLMEPFTFTIARPLSLTTDSIRRQTRLTTQATAAIKAQNWDALKTILQQMHQQQMVDRISESTDTAM